MAKTNQEEIYIIKRNGKRSPFDFNKIVKRLSAHTQGLSGINVKEIALKIANNIVDGITSRKIDQLLAKECFDASIRNPDYDKLAGRMLVSSHHKDSPDSFIEAVRTVYKANQTHSRKLGRLVPRLISEDFMNLAEKYAQEVEEMIDYSRDFNFNYFGFLTYKAKFLMGLPLKKDQLEKDKVAIERPQHTCMRIALEIYGGKSGIDGEVDLSKVKRAYDLLSGFYASFATPTNMNSGTVKNQKSSCFLLDVEDDSIDGIYTTMKEIALISQATGGVGIAVSKIRASGSLISTTGYPCTGVLPVVQQFSKVSEYVNQGGKRNGAVAAYIETFHLDLYAVIESRNNSAQERSAPSINPAVWMNSLLIERVKSGGDWTFFCPSECPELIDLYGNDFKVKYEEYEKDETIFNKKVMPAVEVMRRISKAVIEHGVYVCYKDNANSKSNQKNVGTILSSNLCAEIMEVASQKETAVCNLASMILWSYVNEDKTFNYDKLGEDVGFVTECLNNVIDTNYYVNDKCRNSNMNNRPIGLGVQGLADVFMMMEIPYDSEEAKLVNKRIFETMYYHAVKSSCEMAKLSGPYDNFKGSPLSEGKFQFDLWRESYKDKGQDELAQEVTLSIGEDKWDELRKEVTTHGVRNSLLIALMPTATTSQTYGSFESFEPVTENLYIRRTDVGELTLINKHLQKLLMSRGLWNTDLINEIISNKGSIEKVESIPQDIRDICKSAYSIKATTLLKMSADRGAFICQSQSLNLYLAEPTINRVATVISKADELGLKTGIYYLKNPMSGTTTPILLTEKKEEEKYDEDKAICSLENREDCDMCGA